VNVADQSEIAVCFPTTEMAVASQVFMYRFRVLLEIESNAKTFGINVAIQDRFEIKVGEWGRKRPCAKPIHIKPPVGTLLATNIQMLEPQPEGFCHSTSRKISEARVFARFSSSLLGKFGDWLNIPGKVWARIIVLLLSLGLIKIALIVRLGKQLFETHWRVALAETNWGDYVLFGGFVFLGVLSLIKLDIQCRLVGLKAVRVANAVIFALGLLFIFLTSHSGENNYLYPILSGVLPWSSLGPYLSLDWFFQPPFLGAWAFVYILVYYVLARTGRERWVLSVTGAFAGLYALLFFRELALCRYQLLVANCLGLASAITGGRSRRPLSLGWALLPGFCALLFAIELLRFAPTEAHYAVIYFWCLLAGTILLFGLATWIARRSGFAYAWQAVALFYFTAFLLLTNLHYPVSTNYARILCLAFEFPQYFAWEVCAAATLTFFAIAYIRIFPKASLWWLDGVALLLIAVSLVDFRISQILGVRLEWSVLALGNDARMIWRMAAPYLPVTFSALGVLCAIYFLSVTQFQKNFHRPSHAGQRRSLPSGFWFSTVCFIALGVMGLVTTDPDRAHGQAFIRLAQTSPVWQRWSSQAMSRSQFLKEAKALGLCDFQLQVRARSLQPRRDLNVVLVLMESTFNQHLSLFGASEDTQPLLSQYKDRMELFPNFFSTFASSIHARFSVFTSLYPIQDYNAFTLQRVPVKSLFEVLHENGYSCSLFYSSFADFTGFRDFLNQRDIDEFYDADNMPGQRATPRVAWGLREEETLGAIKSWLSKRASDPGRFFMTYVPAAPHEPFEQVPARFQHFQAGEPGDRTHSYLNQLLYMDWVLASILDELKTG